MARKKSSKRAAKPARSGGPSLKLVRVDPSAGRALHLVFEDGEAERLWRLEPVSAREFLALLLRGEMRKGGRVVLKGAEATVEPGERNSSAPMLCLSLGHVEVCIAVERGALGALGREIERALQP